MGKTELPYTASTQATGTRSEDCSTRGAAAGTALLCRDHMEAGGPNTAQTQHLHCHCKASLCQQPVGQHISWRPHGALIHSKAVSQLGNLTQFSHPLWGKLKATSAAEISLSPRGGEDDHYIPRKENKPCKRHQKLELLPKEGKLCLSPPGIPPPLARHKGHLSCVRKGSLAKASQPVLQENPGAS